MFGSRSIQDGGEWIAMESLESIAPFQSKRNLLISAARRRVPKVQVDKLSKLLKDIQDLQERRNAIVHARWALDDKHNDKLVWMGRATDADKQKLYSEVDFLEVLTKIETAANSLLMFWATEMLPHLKRIADKHIANIIAIKQRENSI